MSGKADELDVPIIIQKLCEDLEKNGRGAAELAGCGPAVPRLLRRALLTRSEETARTLLDLAVEHVQSVPFNLVQACWLRLYTDATIALSTLELLQPAGIDLWRVIRRLDTGIIVAGAVGEGRMEWIQVLIQACQRHIKPRVFEGRDTIADSHMPDFAPECAPIAIPSLSRPPSVSRYLDFEKERPFILRSHLAPKPDGTTGWPALERWGSAEYLLSATGRGRIVPVELGVSYDDEDWSQRLLPFEDFLEQAGFTGEVPDENARPVYLAQYGLFDQFPKLRSDFFFPDYVWSQPAAPSDLPSYRPPATDDGVIVNAWIGSASSQIISPAHTDPYYNCYVQVLGKKRVWVAPPSVGTHMNAYADHEDDETDRLQTYMTNTSRVPIFRKGFQDKSLFPDFFEHVWPKAMEAVLEPGDLLVMPPGWWHSMRGEGGGVSWSVSMWY